MKRAGTVRCPHCFYLVKIPTEVSQIQKLKILSKPYVQSSRKTKEPEVYEAESLKFENLDSEAIFNSCPVCNLIFEEGQNLIKCNNCGTIYHEHCFSTLFNNHCKKCDAILKR
jgi:hypothetical protein